MCDVAAGLEVRLAVPGQCRRMTWMAQGGLRKGKLGMRERLVAPLEHADLADEQILRSHTQRVGNSVNVHEAKVLFPALDAAQIGPIEVGGERNVLLRHILGHAEVAEARAEALFDPVLLRLVHAGMSARCGL